MELSGTGGIYSMDVVIMPAIMDKIAVVAVVAVVVPVRRLGREMPVSSASQQVSQPAV